MRPIKNNTPVATPADSPLCVFESGMFMFVDVDVDNDDDIIVVAGAIADALADAVVVNAPGIDNVVYRPRAYPNAMKIGLPTSHMSRK